MKKAIYHILFAAALFAGVEAQGQSAGQAQAQNAGQAQQAAQLKPQQRAEVKSVRQGNSDFRHKRYKEAEIDYRKALVADSLSVAANYNLASTLYNRQDYDNASKFIETAASAVEGKHVADVHYNAGDIAIAKEDWGKAMEEFKKALLADPTDMHAKENYQYAKLKKQEEDQNQDQNQDNNQDQNNDQNQNQDQNNDQNQDQDNKDDQNNDQNQNQDQNKDQDDRQQQGGISPQQAQQMLNAIQAKEKETQEKVNKEKAELLKSKQKEKNW